MGLDNFFRIRQIVSLEVPISPCGLWSKPGVTNSDVVILIPTDKSPHQMSSLAWYSQSTGAILARQQKIRMLFISWSFVRIPDFPCLFLSSCNPENKFIPSTVAKEMSGPLPSMFLTLPHRPSQDGGVPTYLTPLKKNKKKQHWVFFRDDQRSITWYDSSYFCAGTKTKLINRDPTFSAVLVSKTNLMEKTTEY